MTASNEAVRGNPAPLEKPEHPQRRVGTFTLGVTLVGAGAAMLSSMFFPAIHPERFLQASPVILILLGLETLLSVRKGGRIKYDFLGIILCFLLTCAALSMYAAAWYFFEDGPLSRLNHITTRYVGDTSYVMTFENLDTSDGHILHLNSGDVLWEEFALTGGSVDVEICDLDGNTLAEHTAFPSASGWENFVNIPADGAYWVRIDGDFATGSFNIGTAEPESPETAGIPETPDTAE